MDKQIINGLNDLSKKIHEAAIRKGFWDTEREIGTLLMLCVSELSEALEADRKDRFANAERYDKMVAKVQDYTREDFKLEKEKFYFEENIKDTFEDEIADTVIRILDLCGSRGIDLERHIDLKLKYNANREKMHGKKY
jgi:NTP pyrophosphatase (non-canonical NTP hydrolase)